MRKPDFSSRSITQSKIRHYPEILQGRVHVSNSLAKAARQATSPTDLFKGKESIGQMFPLPSMDKQDTWFPKLQNSLDSLNYTILEGEKTFGCHSQRSSIARFYVRGHDITHERPRRLPVLRAASLYLERSSAKRCLRIQLIIWW